MTFRTPSALGLLLLLAPLLPAQQPQARPGAAAALPSPTGAWPTATLESQGLAREPLETLVNRVHIGSMGNVDRMVVVRNGQLVMDQRFTPDYRELSKGKKSPIGCGIDACADSSQLNEFNYLHPNWHPWYRGRDIHTLQSVTKSVTATLFGVALQRGELKTVDAPLLSFFPSYDVSKVDNRLRAATLEDLLTMRLGMEWHENDRPLDSTNTTLQLEHSRDWIRFTLAQPSDTVPRTKWVYNSGASALMAEVLRKVTGVHAHQYAAQHLFTPLGIKDFHWKLTPTGHPDTEGGLYLEARDLAKIGQLYLNDGMWGNTRILAPGWAKQAIARQVDRTAATPTSPGYGYQWWRYDRRGVDIWAGNGFGGQFLIIIPQYGIVGVTNAWNVFGTPAAGMLMPFIDALLTSAGVAPAAR
ncbi:MAG: serine hydrolase [Gemmatimonadota bacterium]